MDISKIAKHFYDPSGPLVFIVSTIMVAILATVVTFVSMGDRTAAAKAALVGIVIVAIFLVVMISALLYHRYEKK